MKRSMLVGLDGADPIRVKRLIAEGRMPNAKKLLESGVAGEDLDMLGVMPCGTPPNWATLATGAYPRTHGITDFFNQTLGEPLSIFDRNWNTKNIEAELIWEAFNDENKKCILLNYCEGWPNRIPGSNNIVIDGTGVIPFLKSTAGFQRAITLDEECEAVEELRHAVSMSSSDCVVLKEQEEEQKKAAAKISNADWVDAIVHGGHFGAYDVDAFPAVVLYKFSGEETANGDAADRQSSPLRPATNWGFEVPENAKEGVLLMNKGLAHRYILLTASDGEHYDTFTIYASKKKDEPLGSCTLTTWSEPIYDKFNIEDELVNVAYYIHGIDANEDGTVARLYVGHVLDLDDDTYYYPASLKDDLMENVGPMCMFAPFERFTEAGDEIAISAFDKINDWHMEATRYLFEQNPDWQLFYTHLHSIDLVNHWYIEQSIPGSHPEWERMNDNIDRMYEINDKFIGMALEYMDEDTSIFVVSDHGAIPRSVGYENPGIGELSGINAGVMNELGYTVIEPDENIEGLMSIDWTKTRAVNPRTSWIYVNLKGRDPGGIVEPEDYEELVQQIISDLYAYRDPKTGDRVVSFAMTRQEMESLGVGGDHAGDIFFQLTKDFGFEHFNQPGNVVNHNCSSDCLLIMGGGGLKKGVTLDRPVRNVDVVPTICELVGNRMPEQVEGGVIYQALEK